MVEPRAAAVLIEDAARQAAGVLRDAALEAVAVAEPLDLAVWVIRGGGGMAAGLGGLAEGVGGEGQAQGGAGRGVGVGERGVVAEGGVAAGEAEGSVFRRQVQGFGGGQAARRGERHCTDLTRSVSSNCQHATVLAGIGLPKQQARQAPILNDGAFFVPVAFDDGCAFRRFMAGGAWEPKGSPALLPGRPTARRPPPRVTDFFRSRGPR